LLLPELELEKEYKTGSSNEPLTLYTTAFPAAIEYKRAAGFFSSSIFDLFRPEILAFAKRGGQIEIICSPKLSEEDIEKLTEGYGEAATVCEESIEAELQYFFENSSQLTHFEFASTLIKHEILTINIALVYKGYGMFHDKTGYFKDLAGNVVSFSGSGNESGMALSGIGNFERFKVFKSWRISRGDAITVSKIFPT